MKKFLMGIFMALLSVFAFAEADYHIGIVTGTVSQSEDTARGAETAIARYGAAEKGGKIVPLHIRITLCRKWKLQFLK